MMVYFYHLWAIVQYGENIIWSVVAVDRPLFKEVTADALQSLLKVLLLPRLDVVKVYRDEVVPVRPGVLMHEAKSVKQLMDRVCQARVETAAEI